MSDGPRSRWYRPVVLVMTIGTVRASAQVAPQFLPVCDQVTLFAAALRATAAKQAHLGLPTRLALIPLTEVAVIDFAAPKDGWHPVPLDTAVSGALLRAVAVAGLCLPARQARRCGNNERGIGVLLTTFGAPWVDSSRVNVDVTVQFVQADRDADIPVGTPRHDFWSFVREGRHWWLAKPDLRP